MRDDTPEIRTTEFDPLRVAQALEARLANRVLALAPEAVGNTLSFARARFDRANGGDAEESFTLDGDVAIISIEGPLYQRAVSMCGMTIVDGYDAIERRAREAFASNDVAAVLLDVDSPGGDAAGVSELMAGLRALTSESGKPLHARASEMAASAAYWLASAADSISLPRTGQVGSIGTIVMGLNRHGEIAAKGQRVIVAASPRGKLLAAAASVLDPGDAEKMAQLGARMQARAEELTAIFAGDVASRRGMSVEAVLALDAAMFGGDAAVAAGLADHIGPRAAAMDQLKSKVKRKVYSMSMAGTLAEASAPATLEVTDDHARLLALGAAIEALSSQQGEAALALVRAWKDGAARVPDLEKRVKVEALSGRLANKYPPAERFAIGAAGLPDPSAGPAEKFADMTLAVFDARTAGDTVHTAMSGPPAPKPVGASGLTPDEEAMCKREGMDPALYAKHKARVYGG